MSKPLMQSLERRQLLTSGSYVHADVPDVPRTELAIDEGWRFTRNSPAGAEALAYRDSKWSRVDLPHTWNATDGQDGGNDYWRGTATYRKWLTVPESWSKKRVVLRFDGASISADVFVNGTRVGTHVGAASAFSIDITGQLDFGSKQNVIAVRVDNRRDENVPPKGGDFTQFGGLYRGVSLVLANRAQVSPLDRGSPGVWITQDQVSRDSAQVNIRTLVRNTNTGPRTYKVLADIYDAEGRLVESVDSGTRYFRKRQSRNVYSSVTIDNPRLWDGVVDPHLYTVQARVVDTQGNTLDAINQPLGIRTMEIDPERGFLLNGRVYQLRGSNLHEDRLNKGKAISDADREQDMDLLREMGANAVRFVHWQHDRYVYELADRMGMIVWTEIPLWGYITESTGYTRNATDQLRELIRQNFNHPSIAMWGLFNELPDSQGVRNLITTLQQVAKDEDPDRMTVAATNVDFPAALNNIPDHVAFNKYIGWYSKSIYDFGDWLSAQMAARGGRSMAMGEYGAGGSIFQHQANPPRPVPDGPWHPEEYQSLLHEVYYREIAKYPQMWGVFTWQFTDSANDNRDEGDTAGRNDKGLLTYDRRTKKDAFYFYKAQWSSEPVAHITSRRWTERDTATTDVKAYSNLSNVRLSLNGISLGQQSSSDGIFRWNNVTLRPGENTLTLTGTRGGKTYTDTVKWNYTP